MTILEPSHRVRSSLGFRALDSSRCSESNEGAGAGDLGGSVSTQPSCPFRLASTLRAPCEASPNLTDHRARRTCNRNRPRREFEYGQSQLATIGVRPRPWDTQGKDQPGYHGAATCQRHLSSAVQTTLPFLIPMHGAAFVYQPRCTPSENGIVLPKATIWSSVGRNPVPCLPARGLRLVREELGPRYFS